MTATKEQVAAQILIAEDRAQLLEVLKRVAKTNGRISSTLLADVLVSIGKSVSLPDRIGALLAEHRLAPTFKYPVGTKVTSKYVKSLGVHPVGEIVAHAVSDHGQVCNLCRFPGFDGHKGCAGEVSLVEDYKGETKDHWWTYDCDIEVVP